MRGPADGEVVVDLTGPKTTIGDLKPGKEPARTLGNPEGGGDLEFCLQVQAGNPLQTFEFDCGSAASKRRWCGVLQLAAELQRETKTQPHTTPAAAVLPDLPVQSGSSFLAVVYRQEWIPVSQH